jgi:hypothetical protein
MDRMMQVQQQQQHRYTTNTNSNGEYYLLLIKDISLLPIPRVSRVKLTLHFFTDGPNDARTTAAAETTTTQVYQLREL